MEELHLNHLAQEILQSTQLLSLYIRITADTEKITEPTKVYYYCEEHPNMGGILNIIPCESTPTPIAQQDPTPTPTNGNGGTDDSGDTNGGGSNNDGETDGGDSNLSSSPIVSVSGEYCTSDTTPTWTINYDTSYPHPIEYEVKINSDGEVFTITEQSYTAPNTLEHDGTHFMCVEKVLKIVGVIGKHQEQK